MEVLVPLPTRKIGAVDVSGIGFNAMGFSSAHSESAPTEERLKFLDMVYASGCTYWDTADICGASEELIGQWFKRTGNREDIFIATKFGFVLHDPNRVVNGAPTYAMAAVDKSLRRLGIDQIDLYYLHRPDPTVPIEETIRSMAEAVKAGKVKYLGLTDCSADTLRRAHSVHPIAAVQVEYSLFTLDIDRGNIGLLQAAKELGVSIVVYAPLGRGLLTNQYLQKSLPGFEEDDFRRQIFSSWEKNFPNLRKLAHGLTTIGERHNATAAQIALAWLLAQSEHIIPIPNTTKICNLKENLQSLHIKLNHSELQEVRQIAMHADSNQDGHLPRNLSPYLFAETPLRRSLVA